MNTKFLLHWIAGSVAGIVLAAQSVAQNAATNSGKDVEAWFAQPQRGFISSRPALEWGESLLTGNGTMGVMVPGNPIDETLYLSHAALYLPREKRSKSKPVVMSNVLPEIRKLCMEGKYKEAGLAMDKAIRSMPYEPTLTDTYIGAMTLQIEQENADVTRYQRSVDFMTGETSVTYATLQGIFRRSTFVSRADQVIVVRLTGSGPQSAAVSFNELPGATFKEIREIAKRVESLEVGALPDKYIKFQTTYATPNDFNPLLGCEAVGRIVHKGGSFGRTAPGYKVQDAHEILVLVKIRPRLRGEEKSNLEAIQSELAALPADYDQLLAAHAKIHGDLMRRVSFSLNSPAGERAKSSDQLIDEAKENKEAKGRKSAKAAAEAEEIKAPLAQIERAFDAGRYNIISSTGYNPPNLQGLWNGCWLAPWGSAMTTDGNLPCAVSFLAMGNTPELLEPYFRYHERFVPGYRELARQILGTRGLLMPAQLTTAPVFVGVGAAYPFYYWYTGMPWALQSYYDYWLTTGDRKFLAERAYPLMKEMAAFYEDFLKETDKNGKLVFAPSYSPENQPDGTGSCLTVNATAEIAAAKQLLRHTIAAAKELGCDMELQKKWGEIIAKLPDYEVGEDGSFKEWLWPGLKDRNDHRHAMHFYPLYDEMPGELVNNPELVKAVAHSVQERFAYLDHSAGLSFGYAFVSLAAARTGHAELAQHGINAMAREGWLSGMGNKHLLRLPMFNVDICGGFPYVCASTLVYSDPGLIRFFPARPPQWQSGSIKGLRLRGAITLKELTWGDGKARALLVSDKDQEVTIFMPGGGSRKCTLAAGKDKEINIERN